MGKPTNIVRIDVKNRNTHGWQVRITRHRRQHTKFFSDSIFGSSDDAFQAAEAYRDSLLDALPAPLAGAELAAQARSTTGVPGIRLAVSDGIPRIEADAVDPVDGRMVRTFSLRKWGLRKALWKACSWKAATHHSPPLPQQVQEMYSKAYPAIKRQIVMRDAIDIKKIKLA